MLVSSSGSKGGPEGPAPLPLLKLVQKKMAGAGPQVSQVIGPPLGQISGSATGFILYSLCSVRYITKSFYEKSFWIQF